MLHVWTMYQHLPQKKHPHVSKYTIHGVSRDGYIITNNYWDNTGCYSYPNIYYSYDPNSYLLS